MAASVKPDELAVLGAGSWGTALALVLARNGCRVRLWGHDPQHLQALATDGENRRHLPGHPFPDTLRAEADLGAAVDGVDEVLVVVPSAGFRDLLGRLAPLLAPGARLAWATKGLDAGSGGLLSQVADELLPGRPQAVLSGPSFAGEVARGLPTAVTVASRDAAFAAGLARAFHSARFRVYTSDDPVGVQLGGAVKNVLAVATGMADGMGMGANARAGLVTRGLAELARLTEAVGGHRRTVMGLAGIGDLILTCTDDQSRNRRLGLALGAGKELAEAVRAIGQTVEGVRTAAEVRRLALRQVVEMPICEQVHYTLGGHLTPREAAARLMQRAPKAEFGGSLGA